MANPLDIDSKGLNYDFLRDWTMFKDARVRTFLIFYYQKRIEDHQVLMETVTSENLSRMQGQIHEMRQMVNLLMLDNVVEPVRSVGEYITKKKK